MGGINCIYHLFIWLHCFTNIHRVDPQSNPSFAGLLTNICPQYVHVHIHTRRRTCTLQIQNIIYIYEWTSANRAHNRTYKAMMKETHWLIKLRLDSLVDISRPRSEDSYYSSLSSQLCWVLHHELRCGKWVWRETSAAHFGIANGGSIVQPR